LALNPRGVEAQIWSALMLINRVLDFVNGHFHYDASDIDLQRADELIAQALGVSPNSAWAHYVKGQVLRAQSRFEDAAIEYETAIAFDRNLANAYAWLGLCKLQISEFPTGDFGSNRQAVSVETDRPFRSKAAPRCEWVLVPALANRRCVIHPILLWSAKASTLVIIIVFSDCCGRL
jgi:tetratricopeptide (TPR) repeat protein